MKLRLDERGLSPLVAVIVLLTLVMVLSFTGPASALPEITTREITPLKWDEQLTSISNEKTLTASWFAPPPHSDYGLGTSTAPPSLGEDKISLTISFPAPEVIRAGEYHRVRVEGLESFGNPGEPKLPIRSVRVLIPFGSEVKGVRVFHGRRVILDGSYHVEPAQMPVPLSSSGPLEPTPPDEQIYNSSHPFPARVYSDPLAQSKRGYQILILNLYPVSYLPAEGKLSYFEEMIVEVELRLSPMEGLSVRCSSEDRREIRRMVDNPEAIDSYPLEYGPLEGENRYGYVIITSEDLENYSGDYDWQTLCDRKESRGITTKIVTLDWIYSIYSGVDDPEKIRNFIKDAYDNWGTEYVLLGGDDTVVPFRRFWVQAGGYEANMPSDMYYSCLDGTFNYDNDDLWGEPNDGPDGGEVDLYAEVYVGRAPVANEVDVSNFVRKTLAFEDFVPEDRYLAYMVGEHLGFGGVAEYAKAYKEEVRLGSDNYDYSTVGLASCDFVETSTLYEKDNSWSKHDLIDIIDNGVWALNHLGHGGTGYAMKLYNSDLDSLANTEYFFAYSQTCSAGHFDDTECWAEKAVRMKNGAAAVVMNARYGWGTYNSTNGPSQHFDREFWDAVFGENIYTMGWANSDSKEDQDWYVSGSSYGRWCAYELNLFGDPELHFASFLVKVGISPSESEGLPGTTLDYTVRVWNGNRTDNYNLTVSDAESWDLNLSENLFENMRPYEIRKATLSVAIPDNADPGTEDEITVVVISQENAEVKDNASCMARVPPRRRVEVSIMPSENDGLPSEDIGFTVLAKNTGIENDNYRLTVEDTLGWSLTLSENLFEDMVYGEEQTTTLHVHVPENAMRYTDDDVTVTAASTENTEVHGVSTCIAHVIPIRLSPPHSDNGLDTDNDNLYNYLVVEVGVEVGIEGLYKVSGDLYDEWYWITSASTESYLETGTQTLELRFEGYRIERSERDGPYYVYLDLRDNEWNWLDSDEYETEPYSYENFQYLAKFFPPHSDNGLDTDNDNLFNYLVVEVDVEVGIAGWYEVYGSLQDNEWNWITSAWIENYLDVGTQTLELRFEGYRIERSGKDGPYRVSMTLYGEVEEWWWEWLDSDEHWTQPYSHENFQRPPAVLTPPHSDYGLDTDNDGLFNYLVVEVKLDVDEAGWYEVDGSLRADEWYWITSAWIENYLGTGSQTLELRFNGYAIERSGIDGPYRVDLTLYDDEWNWLDEDEHETEPYSYENFQYLAKFSPPHSDNGLDTDNDNLYNYLVVEARVDVRTPGQYQISGSLYDNMGDSIPGAYVWVENYLSTGVQTIELRFNGYAIERSGRDGPYRAYLSLYSFEWPDSWDSDEHWTQPYSHENFQRPPAVLTPPHSDYGLDTDNDGLFNYLVVEVKLDVDEAGWYEVDGSLRADEWYWITSASTENYLETGTQTLELRFEGYRIERSERDGPYYVYLDLRDNEWNWLDSDEYETEPYSYENFQYLAKFFPPHSDNGLDTDNDNLYNYLVVEVNVEVGIAGWYEVYGSLQDNEWNWITSAWIENYLDVGTQTLELRFEGYRIERSGKDGPYRVNMTLYRGVENWWWEWLDSDEHLTQAYTHDEFQPPPARFLPPHSDNGLDTDNDNLFNYLVVEVNVAVAEAGGYRLSVNLYDAAGYYLGYAWADNYLDVGTQTLEFRFDGRWINRSGRDGPYQAYLSLYDNEWDWLDSGEHETEAYTYDQFQPPPPPVANYVKSSPQYEWTPRVSATDAANGDDVGTWVDLPFEFPFWGEPKTRAYVCSNGFLIFDPTPATNDCSNSLEELMERCKIAPFWDDLRTDTAGGIVSDPGVYVDSYGDKVVITWEVTRSGSSSDSIKFQIILYSNGDIRINIDNATGFSNFSPTLGISNGEGWYFDITDERGTNKSWLFSLVRRGVDVSISPSYQSGLPRATLTYAITVTNRENVVDNYDLRVSDNADLSWGPTLDNYRFENVPPGENRTATLSVTIPEDAENCTKDNITVVAMGGTGVENSASCIAHAIVMENLWDALITATYSGGSDDAIFGVRPDATSGFDSAYDLPESPPPPESPYVQTFFYYPGNAPDPTKKLHRSCIPPENLMEWPLRISYHDGIENITVSWNIENIPAEYSVILLVDNILVADMRTTDNYTFAASAQDYDFRIIVGRILPFTFRLVMGWNMISLPVMPPNPDPDAIFGDSYYVMYRWDAENRRYVTHADSGGYVEPDPNVEAGVGYWIYMLENRDVTILGVPITQLTLTLRSGWNMIGSLYYTSSLADPIDDPDGSVLNWAFTWGAHHKRYDMTQLLDLGGGYWVYALDNCILTLTPSPVITVLVAPVSSLDALITATFSGGSDDAIFGVRPDATSGFDNAYDLPESPPPPEPPYVRTYFYYPANTPYPTKLHRSCIASENLMEWPLRISYVDTVENITLSWSVENIPAEYLVHLLIGENLIADMRVVDNYTFQASADDHDFVIRVSPTLPPPTKPTLVSPADGTITNDNTPTFIWTKGENADNHRLQVDNDSNFSSPEINVLLSTTDNTYTPTTGLADENYSWKVIAINAIGENESPTWTFVIDTITPSVPTPYLPVDGTVTNDNTVYFEWSSIADAEDYDLFVDNDANFSSLEVSVTITENYHTSSALPDENYSWRVRTRDAANNVSDNSATWTLLIDVTAPPAPTPMLPSDGTFTNDNTPVFDWSDVTDPSGVTYNLFVDDDDDFASLDISQIGLTESTFTPTVELDEENYSWRVCAVDGATNVGDNSVTWTFLIDTIAPATPTPVSPKDNAVESALTQTFTWTEPESGVTYDIQIDNETSFTPPHLENTSLTDNSYTYTFASNGVYYWRVRAVDAANNQSSWADNFKLTIQAPPRQPTLYQPADGAITNDNTPTFEWTVGSGATYHRLQIDNDPEFSSPIYDNSNITDNVCTIENELPEGSYRWRVAAGNAQGENWSAENWVLTINITPPDNPTLSLADQTSGSTTYTNSQTVNVTVENDSGADKWLISESQSTQPAEDAAGWSTEPTTFNLSAGDGSKTVYIWVKDAAGNINAGPISASITLDMTINAPTLALTDQTSGSSTYTNSTTVNATITEDSDVVAWLLNETQTTPPAEDNTEWVTTEPTTFTLSSGDGLKIVYVWVKDQAGNVYQTAVTDTITLDTTAPGKPTLTSPENNSTESTLSITFTWTENKSSDTYHIQIDNEASLTPPHVHENSRLTENSYTYIFASYGTYYWRVCAEDNAGNVGQWADNFKLIIEAAAPDFSISVSPTSGSVVQGESITATVSVSSIAGFSETVWLWASGLPSKATASFSPPSGTPSFDSTLTISTKSDTPTGTYSITITGIGGGKTHTCPYTLTVTEYTPPPDDTTPPPTPSLVSPTNGENITDNTPTLDWSDVSDPSGVTYDLSIAGDAGFTSIVLQKTDLTASAYEITPAETLTDGTYYWRVRGVDGAGNAGSWSENWSFTVSMPPALATLTADTTPIKASVYVDNALWGTAPQTRPVDPGTYTVSFGDYLGYLTPLPQTVSISAGEERTVTGTYTEIPPELIENESSVDIPSITTDENAVIEVENTAITGMTIDVGENVENVRITVQQLTDKPAEVAIGAPGVTYRYLNIVAENITDADIDVVLIDFRVERAWATAENIKPDTIALRRWVAGAWVSLPTAKVGEDDTYFYFSAESPGLSIFAISGSVIAPAEFVPSELVIEPKEVGPGENVGISVRVTNIGDLEGTHTVTLKINDLVEATENVTLAGGAAETVTFTVSRDAEGTYDVEVDGLSGSFEVKVAPSIPWPIIVAIVLLVIIVVVMLYRRRTKD